MHGYNKRDYIMMILGRWTLDSSYYWRTHSDSDAATAVYVWVFLSCGIVAIIFFFQMNANDIKMSERKKQHKKSINNNNLLL